MLAVVLFVLCVLCDVFVDLRVVCCWLCVDCDCCLLIVVVLAAVN